MFKNSIYGLVFSTTLRKHAGPVLFFMVCSNVLMLAVPVYMSQVYDRVLTSRSFETLGFLTLLTVAALVTYGLLEGIRGVLAHRVVTQFMATTAHDVMAYLVRSSMPEAKRNQIVRDMNQLGTFLAGRSAMGLLDLPFVPVFVALLAVVHWQLAILSIVSILAIAATTWLNNRFSKELEKKASDETNDAMQVASHTFSRDEDVRAMGMHSVMLSRWSAVMGKALTAADSATSISSKMYGFSKLVRQLVQISQLGLGAILVLRGEMSGGLIFVAATLAGRALQPAEQLIGASSSVMQAQASWARVEEALAKASNSNAAMELPLTQGKLDIEGVSFHADGKEDGRVIVSGVNLSLVPGRLTALVGPSGAGKSTLARIVAGAVLPTKGVVRLDGFDYEQWLPDARGQAVGYVAQDVNLFPGTVADNISRMAQQRDERLILDASMKAGVHELIAALPDGYNTKVGPGGLRLSGGQRQRIALARAFYGAPRLLVLDEPNSNLDTAGEKILADALLQAKKLGMTILLVSQRESILSIADRILVMEAGRIARDLVPAPAKPAAPAQPQTPAAPQVRVAASADIPTLRVPTLQ